MRTQSGFLNSGVIYITLEWGNCSGYRGFLHFRESTFGCIPFSVHLYLGTNFHVTKINAHRRHPESSSRPCFQDILSALHKDEGQVLEIPANAAQSHPRAATLGAFLDAGAVMYQDICMQYSRYSPVACTSEQDYDDITG